MINIRWLMLDDYYLGLLGSSIRLLGLLGSTNIRWLILDDYYLGLLGSSMRLLGLLGSTNIRWLGSNIRWLLLRIIR